MKTCFAGLAGVIALLATPAVAAPATCTTPVHVKIGTVDSKFGISQGDAISAIEDAVLTWNVAAHHTVAVVDSTDGIPINLVYDQRQQATQQYVQARANMRAATTKAQVIVAELAPLQTVLNETLNSYSSQLISFERVREIQALSGSGGMMHDRQAALATMHKTL